MLKQLILILSAMLIVFSLTIIAGGASYTFYISQGAGLDQDVKTALFWAGAFTSLFGLAGFLAGLVGLTGSAIIKVSETTEEEVEAGQESETNK